jgi:phage N-6-adenine-methyltransferase
VIPTSCPIDTELSSGDAPRDGAARVEQARELGHIHPAAALFPMLPDEDLDALAVDIAVHGQRIPIATWHGQILDGRNRLEACRRAGVEPWVEAADLADDAEAVGFVISSNLKRRHLDESQRAMIGAKLATLSDGVRADRQGASIEAPSAISQSQAADLLNVGRASVQRARTVLDHGVPELAEAVRDGELAVSAAAKIARMPVESQPAALRQKRLPHQAQATGDFEWYTPAEIIKLARDVMGGIDLDPASSVVANAIVRAERIYTTEDDGLTHAWHGRIWLNPPYAKGLVDRFCASLREEYEAGRVTEAIVLVNNATDTAWYQRLAEVAPAVAFPRGRLRYWRPDRSVVSGSLQGQALIYLGAKPRRFCDVFSAIGDVRVKLDVETCGAEPTAAGQIAEVAT